MTTGTVVFVENRMIRIRLHLHIYGISISSPALRVPTVCELSYIFCLDSSKATSRHGEENVNEKRKSLKKKNQSSTTNKMNHRKIPENFSTRYPEDFLRMS